MDENDENNGHNNHNNNFNNDSYQIAFNSYCYRSNSDSIHFLFSLASMPINLKNIRASFDLYCIEKNFHSNINNHKMSLYTKDGTKQIGQKCFNINELNNNHNLINTNLSWRIAIKVTEFC